MKITKLATVAVSLGLAVGLAACGSSTKSVDKSGSTSGSAAGALVGVTMPTKSSERWIHDGDNVKSALEKLGVSDRAAAVAEAEAISSVLYRDGRPADPMRPARRRDMGPLSVVRLPVLW